ncbi:MAG: hypothetical protein LQ341_002179 [Variospora aurantia]|nr:MAG: hypothetical protein LQ341_002179 [Variospora aurantia]
MAADPGSISAFLDTGCYKPSVINPTISLALNSCLVPTGGAQSFAVQVFPPCASGRATMIMYRDSSCTRPVDGTRDYKNCFWSLSDNVPAVQFVCRDVSNGEVPTSTSTATFGSSLIPVAGAAIETPATGGQTTMGRTSPSSNENASPTSSSDSQPPTSPGTGNIGDNNNNNNDGSDSSSGAGISRRSQIALGVGVPVAALLVALLAWWFPCKKVREHGAFHHHHHHGAAQMQQPPPPQRQQQQHPPSWPSPVSPVQELPGATKGYGYQSSGGMTEYYGSASRSY